MKPKNNNCGIGTTSAVQENSLHWPYLLWPAIYMEIQQRKWLESVQRLQYWRMEVHKCERSSASNSSGYNTLCTYVIVLETTLPMLFEFHETHRGSRTSSTLAELIFTRPPCCYQNIGFYGNGNVILDDCWTKSRSVQSDWNHRLNLACSSPISYSPELGFMNQDTLTS
ncbi:unnamed protein product [Caenorhabditis brenneri]